MIDRIVRFRGLLATLTARELAARYRGSLLGFVWSLVNPLMMLGVYWLVFDVVFQPRVPGARGPYAVFLVTGLFPWIWFSGSLLDACDTLGRNSGLIKKAVFPVEILPIVSVLSHLVHFLLALPIALGAVAVAAALGRPVGGWGVLALPGVVLLQLLFSIGPAMALAALTVHFKDVRDLVTNLLTLGFFMTPVLYPLSGLRELAVPVWLAVQLNPMTPFVESYHDTLFSGVVPPAWRWLEMGGMALISFGLGAWLFDRLRDTLAEAV